MFNKIQAGDKVVVDEQEYGVTRVSNARFWVQMGDEVVKFVKTTGKEYGTAATRQAALVGAEAEAPVEETPAAE